MKDCFGTNSPQYLQKYMDEVYKLNYSEKPAYLKLRELFKDHLHTRDPVKTLEWVVGSPKVRWIVALFIQKKITSLSTLETSK